MADLMNPVDELFVKLPYAVLMDPTLTPADKIVYASLRLWARPEKYKFTLYPSTKSIAKACCLSVRQVRISLGRLADSARPLLKRDGRVHLTTVLTILRLSAVYTPSDLQGRGAAGSAGGEADFASEVDVLK